jgi:2-alkyl-3-oxoalkanoate reductase
MKALVTGAAGFIGSHIVDQLLARGDDVRALVRPTSDTRHLEQAGVELLVGDLTDSSTLSPALSGIDIVYHAAALGKAHSAQAIIRTNVTGTENLLVASAQELVSQFIFISSVSVYAQASIALVSEDAAHGAKDVYGQSKSAAEELVQHYGETYGIAYTILRPCRVYGEPYNHYTARLLRSARSPILIVGSVDCPYYNLVHASDVARSAILSSDCSEAVGQTYNITDGQGASRKEIAQTLRRLTGRKQIIITIPKTLVAFAYAMHAVFLAYRDPRKRTKPSNQWRQLFICQKYDIGKAKRELGYEPQVGLQEGLRRALTWYYMNEQQKQR